MNNIKKTILTLPLLLLTNMSIAKTPTMNWKIKSSSPLDQITFGIKIDAAAPRNQFYFANQFGFTSGGDIGYTGIQPTKNTEDGKRQFKVLFSSFRKDSTPEYKNCKQGADGSKYGVSCGMNIPGKLGDTFLFKVYKEQNLLIGVVKNETNQREYIIGKWTVGDSAGNLASHQTSWIENYKMSDLTCDKKGWPYYEVKFFPPSGNNGKIQGTISGLSRGSDACPGAITWENDSTGTLIKGGYK